jgi:acetolactate synthase-1/2/3 large subunit
LFDQTHACYAGDLGIGPNPKLLERIKSSDLVIVIGGRLGELPSQHYTLFDIPRPQVPFVHVHPGAEELGRVYSPQLAINATPTAFTVALETLKFARAGRRRQGGVRRLSGLDRQSDRTTGTGKFRRGDGMAA